jgi:hypothetical protein
MTPSLSSPSSPSPSSSSSSPNACVAFWRRHTHGTVTFDLKRDHVLDDAFEASAHLARLGTPDQPVSRRFSTQGIRLKVMRHIALGPERLDTIHGRQERVKAIDIGAGVSFELDSASFRPKARVRLLRTVSVGAFPCCHVKFQRHVPIAKTGYSLRVSYFCPLSHLHRPCMSPARLIVTLDDTEHYGVRITHGGLELGWNRRIDMFKGGVVMGSAVLSLPRAVDMSSSESLTRDVTDALSVSMGRSGLKLKF